jgi:hypothetical protein
MRCVAIHTCEQEVATLFMGAEIRAKGAREPARKAAREADRAQAQAWLVRMIKLTETREITPYKWVHPDEER